MEKRLVVLMALVGLTFASGTMVAMKQGGDQGRRRNINDVLKEEEKKIDVVIPYPGVHSQQEIAPFVTLRNQKCKPAFPVPSQNRVPVVRKEGLAFVMSNCLDQDDEQDTKKMLENLAKVNLDKKPVL